MKSCPLKKAEASPPLTTKVGTSLLLGFAGHQIIPVHKRTLGVVPARPDMQLEERAGYGELVRGADEMEGLAFEHGGVLS